MIKDKKLDKARFDCKVIIEGIQQDFDKLIYHSEWDHGPHKHFSHQLFWHLKDAYQDQVNLLENEILRLSGKFK